MYYMLFLCAMKNGVNDIPHQHQNFLEPVLSYLSPLLRIIKPCLFSELVPRFL
jgi:hypothetical protein